MPACGEEVRDEVVVVGDETTAFVSIASDRPRHRAAYPRWPGQCSARVSYVRGEGCEPSCARRARAGGASLRASRRASARPLVRDSLHERPGRRAARILRLFVRLFRDPASRVPRGLGRGEASRGAPFPDGQVQGDPPRARVGREPGWQDGDLRVARGAPGRHPRRARGRLRPSRPRLRPHGEGDPRHRIPHATRERRPQSRLHRRHSRRHARRHAGRIAPRRRADCGRHASRLRRPRRGLLRVQRPGGRRDESVAVLSRTTGGHAHARAHHRPGRASGQRHGEDFRGRFSRRHL